LILERKGGVFLAEDALFGGRGGEKNYNPSFRGGGGGGGGGGMALAGLEGNDRGARKENPPYCGGRGPVLPEEQENFVRRGGGGGKGGLPQKRKALSVGRVSFFRRGGEEGEDPSHWTPGEAGEATKHRRGGRKKPFRILKKKKRTPRYCPQRKSKAGPHKKKEVNQKKRRPFQWRAKITSSNRRESLLHTRLNLQGGKLTSSCRNALLKTRPKKMNSLIAGQGGEGGNPSFFGKKKKGKA